MPFSRPGPVWIVPETGSEYFAFTHVVLTELTDSHSPVLENVDFVHRTPMTVLPTGALCEIDCSCNKFLILEAGTRP